MEALAYTERELRIQQCADDIVARLTSGTPARISLPRISNTGENFILEDEDGRRDLSEFAQRVQEAILQRHDKKVHVACNCINMSIHLTGITRVVLP